MAATVAMVELPPSHSAVAVPLAVTVATGLRVTAALPLQRVATQRPAMATVVGVAAIAAQLPGLTVEMAPQALVATAVIPAPSRVAAAVVVQLWAVTAAMVVKAWPQPAKPAEVMETAAVAAMAAMAAAARVETAPTPQRVALAARVQAVTAA
jgi:hypothetical protein